MSFYRWIPRVRVAAFVLTGLTAGQFVATGMAALAFGWIPPAEVRQFGTAAAYIGLLAAACVVLLDRRKPKQST